MRSIALRLWQDDGHSHEQFDERDEAENAGCPWEADLGLELGEDDRVDYAAYAALTTHTVQGWRDISMAVWGRGGGGRGRWINCGARGSNKDSQGATSLKPRSNQADTGHVEHGTSDANADSLGQQYLIILAGQTQHHDS